MYEMYTGMLNIMDKFQEDKTIVDQDFIYGNKNIEAKYNLWNLTDCGDDFSIAIKVMNWVCSHIYHNNYFNAPLKKEAESLMEFSFDREPEYGLNCRCMSIVLTECLLALNIKARTVYLMPCSPYEDDNYVVTEAYIPAMNKWIMLDPTINGYVQGPSGNPLSILEIREALSTMDTLKFSKGIKYNKEHILTKEVFEHYARFMFYIMTYEVQGTDSEEMAENRLIVGVPEGYDLLNSINLNLKTRDNYYEEPEIFTACKGNAKNISVILKNENFFKK